VTEFKQQWDIDALFVADAALYTAGNLAQMSQLRWVSRVPATLVAAKQLLLEIDSSALVASSLPGYKIAACGNSYAGIQQRWLVVESHQYFSQYSPTSCGDGNGDGFMLTCLQSRSTFTSPSFGQR
jgi:transposase